MHGEWLYYHTQYNQHGALVKTNTSKFNSVIEWIRAKWNILLSRKPNTHHKFFLHSTEKPVHSEIVFYEQISVAIRETFARAHSPPFFGISQKCRWCLLHHWYSGMISICQFDHFLVWLLMDFCLHWFSVPSKRKRTFWGSVMHFSTNKSLLCLKNSRQINKNLLMCFIVPCTTVVYVYCSWGTHSVKI